MSDFDFNFDFDFTNDNEENLSEEPEIQEKKSRRRTTECVELSHRYEMRRAFSESKLLDAMSIEPLKENHSYHFITAGDVDGLSYLKVILLHQKLDYLLFSTWCMSAEDILQIDEWINAGKLNKVDAYVGEIFPNSYKIEWKMLKDLFAKHNCGRVAVFKNYSKIFAGYGDKFYFGIETSANINTNPRTENGCITINKDLFYFYKEYFDGIVSFEK